MPEQPIPVVRNIRIDTGFCADLVVEDKVIVKIKSVKSLAPAQESASGLPLARRQRLGLLTNFHVPLIKDGSCASSTESKTILTPSRKDP